jgi:hypothetical protein
LNIGNQFAREYNAVWEYLMRTLNTFCIALLLAGSLFAQRGGQPVLRGSFPSVVHPAGNAGLPGVTRFTPSVVNPGGGGVHLVVPGNPGGPSVRQFNDRSGRPISYMAYPVYIGGYYDTSYISPQPPIGYQGQPAQQNVTVIYPPQPAAPAMLSPYVPGASTDSSYPSTMPAQQAAEEAAPEPSHYLLAFKDHTIYSAVAYWVDGETLHYFTSGNTHNQVSLSLVDRELTARLNKDSGVDVKLPAAKQ